MSLSIKKGDKVIVIRGDDKGKTGKVLFVDRVSSRVIVEGVNLVKKHIRKRSEDEPAGIKEIPAPLYICNVALFCPNCNRGVRFGVKINEDKSKIRICKRCKQPL
ncbi:MAG: 50S ribosomal protein L24 [Candidatus Omnitrophica bacterium]|nr:50S ribosomal protein L24 [Candidatus Omnitrophota bacterium]MCM8831446.1 50S ribosomal protein L24 [Candidatus Omnitrophota bacterium]